MIDLNTSSSDIRPDDSSIDVEEVEATSEPGILQEFAYSIMNICAREQTGDLNSDEAYQQIKAHWKELKQSQKKQKEKDRKKDHKKKH